MDYKPFLTTDKNGERNDKNSYNEILDRNRIKIAEGILDRHESMIKQLLGDDSNLTETTDSTVAYMKQVPANALNYAELLNVGGMCQKVNQLVSSVSSTSGTINAGEYKELATAKVGGYHKLLVIVSVSSSSLSDIKWRVVGKDASDNFKQVESAASANAFMAELKNYDSTDGLYIRLVNTSESSISYSDASVMLIDLTAIYGAGNEPTSTSDARIQWLMSYLASHPEYDAGSIITAPVTKVISKGFNLWDEETELGYIDANGNLQSSNDYIRSKNFFKVFPNEEYYINIPSGKALYFTEYDANGNFIKQTYRVNETTITTQANTAKVKFYMSGSYGTTYNHDICINVSNASLNGTYMPYRAPIEYPIPAEVRALEGYGYGLSADCNNHVSYEGKMYVQRMEAYTITGNENWSVLPVNNSEACRALGKFMVQRTDLALPKPIKLFPLSSSVIPNITANKFSTVANSIMVSSNDAGENVMSSYGEYLYFQSSAFANKTDEQVKALLAGTQVHYEIATPVETDISEYLPYDDYIEVEGGGTVIFENENEIDVPSEIVYLEEVSE